MNEIMQKTMDALRRNNMTPVYAATCADAVRAVKELLFDGCSILAGGSVTLQESGVMALLRQERYRFFDRSRPGITPEEQTEVYRTAVGCDFYFCSANALTAQGELINVDGNANRVASVCFGPKRVIAVVGKNKLVPDLDAGFLRVKQVAAPKNCVRLHCDTPCAKLGHCVSLERTAHPAIADGCDSPSRICADYVISARQRTPGRITVILVDEELGY